MPPLLLRLLLFSFFVSDLAVFLISWVVVSLDCLERQRSFGIRYLNWGSVFVMRAAYLIFAMMKVSLTCTKLLRAIQPASWCVFLGLLWGEPQGFTWNK